MKMPTICGQILVGVLGLITIPISAFQLSLDLSEENSSRELFRQKLENIGDSQYNAVIKVGGQKLQTIIDTGSFDLVVLDKDCSECGSPQNLFDNSKSKSFKEGYLPAEQEYGSGITYSMNAEDTVSFGPFGVKHQVFWDVFEADMPLLYEDTFAAILGVGPPLSAVKFAEEGSKQVHRELDEYKKAGEQITKAMKNTVKRYDNVAKFVNVSKGFIENIDVRNMSTCFGKKSGSPGWHVWNDVATKKQSEKFQRLKVAGDIYWSVNLTKVTTGLSVSKQDTKRKTIACGKETCSAIIDTGTSLLAAPTDVVEKISTAVEDWASEGGTCDDVSKLPDLQFYLNDQLFSLPPESYVGEATGWWAAEVERLFPSLQRLGRPKKGKECQVLIIPMDLDSQFGPTWILGMPFFRKYYTTFSFKQNNEDRLEAKSMFLSIANDQCEPGASPVTEGKKGSKLDQEQIPLPRGAQLKVNISTIRVPRFATAAARQFLRSKGKLAKPYLHV